MNILHRLNALPKGVRRRLPSALGAVVTAGLLLRVLPYRRVRRLLDGVRGAPAGADAAGPAEIGPAEIGRAVDAVSNRIPGATCLVRALAAEWLVRRAGHPASLQLRVASEASGKIRAHAWVDSNGEAVIGTPGPGEYVALQASAQSSIARS